MQIDPKAIELVKAKQTKEILAAHEAAPFDLDKALASAQERLTKAIELAPGVVPFDSQDCTFIVGEYLVTKEALIVGCTCRSLVHCQCNDHQHRKGRCKHILAAGLYVRSAKLEKDGCNV